MMVTSRGCPAKKEGKEEDRRKTCGNGGYLKRARRKTCGSGGYLKREADLGRFKRKAEAEGLPL